MLHKSNNSGILALSQRDFESAIDSSNAARMRVFNILDTQAKGTETLMQSENLTEVQFDKLIEERKAIRSEASFVQKRCEASNAHMVIVKALVRAVDVLLYVSRVA